MPTRIDQNLIPQVIRESVDPDILNRAQSIEWSIDRDTGENEHGFLDGSHEDYLTSQNLLEKSHGPLHLSSGSPRERKGRKMVEWSADTMSGRDSGFDATPISPSLHKDAAAQQRVDLSPLEDAAISDFAAANKTGSLGPMKRHPQGQHPFPIYKVNQEQLQGDVFFEVAPRAKPGERTVHYEKSSRVLNEEEMNALGLDPNVFGPNSRTIMDEQEEETIETQVLKGGSRELEDIYNSMRTGAGDYFDRQRARSLSPSGDRRPIGTESSEQRRTVVFGSVGEIDKCEQEYYPYRDAHQGKVSVASHSNSNWNRAQVTSSSLLTCCRCFNLKITPQQPLPGDNEYGTWGSRFEEQRQWKLCNGQWVRVAEPKKPEPPKYEKYHAERLKCKEPKKRIARSEPVRRVEPEGSTDEGSDDDDDSFVDNLEPLVVDLEPRRRPHVAAQKPLPSRRIFSPPSSLDLEPEVVDHWKPTRCPVEEPPIDLDALKDKYRPKAADKVPSIDDDYSPQDNKNDTKASPDPKTGTILLEPIRPPTPPLEEIKAEPIQPVYVEMKKPLRREYIIPVLTYHLPNPDSCN